MNLWLSTVLTFLHCVVFNLTLINIYLFVSIHICVAVLTPSEEYLMIFYTNIISSCHKLLASVQLRWEETSYLPFSVVAIHMWPTQSKQGTSWSDKFLIKVEINSAGYFYPVLYNHSVHSYLEAVELPRFILTIIKGVTHERTPSMVCAWHYVWLNA